MTINTVVAPSKLETIITYMPKFTPIHARNVTKHLNIFYFVENIFVETNTTLIPCMYKL